MLRTCLPLRAALLALISCAALAACQDIAPGIEAPVAAPEAEDGASEIDMKLPQMVCGAEGFIGPDDTRETLGARFSAENLIEEELSWVDSSETALVLYPAEPATRAEMFWLDKTSGGPRYVRAGGAESLWIGPGGLFPGASLADVEAANGGPFEMMGFQHHSAGEVTDWLGGALAAKPGDTCEFALVMALPEAVSSEASSPVSGDPGAFFRSDSPEMRAANPSVDTLALNFFDPA